jgi:hypothetical protein
MAFRALRMVAMSSFLSASLFGCGAGLPEEMEPEVVETQSVADTEDVGEVQQLACTSSSGINSGNYTRYSASGLSTLARNAGMACGRNLVVSVAVALAESDGYQYAYHINTNCSVDRGLWQINSIHGSLSTYDAAGNARAMYLISSNGTNFNPWVAYTNGRFWNYWGTACSAVKAQCGTWVDC